MTRKEKRGNGTNVVRVRAGRRLGPGMKSNRIKKGPKCGQRALK